MITNDERAARLSDARLQEHFDEPRLVELAAVENYRARFNRVFLIEPNALSCPIGEH